MTAPKLQALLIKRKWTADEDALLRSSYANATNVGALVPGRSTTAIVRRASELAIRRPASRPHPGKVVSPVISREGVPGKHCIDCLTWKPLEKFSRHQTCAGGRRNQCTTCEGRRTYANHRERSIEATRKWQAEHPETFKNSGRVARSWRRERIGGGRVTRPELDALFAQYEGRCVYCGDVADSIDHVVPLSRGGAHEVGNLAPACMPCNRSKKDKLLCEWLGRRK